MKHEKKIEWMAMWAVKNNAALMLEGECGFGRECVGIIVGECFPSYEWDHEDTYERIDNNGDVWVPDDAYHKSPCVAVLGRGEPAESQLYDWLVWFDANGFKLEEGTVERDAPFDAIDLILGKHRYSRMIKQAE
ncbi:MAG: hypothetical protein KUG81_09985 [Gammaproteobacteria bacterium]|nr:hypothetical protein [Gammaproteobacteria bacterium]